MTFNPEAYDALTVAQDWMSHDDYWTRFLADVDTITDAVDGDWELSTTGVLMLVTQTGTVGTEYAYISPDGDAWDGSLTRAGMAVLADVDN